MVSFLVSYLLSWCFEPSQPLGVASGLLCFVDCHKLCEQSSSTQKERKEMLDFGEIRAMQQKICLSKRQVPVDFLAAGQKDSVSSHSSVLVPSVTV